LHFVIPGPAFAGVNLSPRKREAGIKMLLLKFLCFAVDYKIEIQMWEAEDE